VEAVGVTDDPLELFAKVERQADAGNRSDRTNSSSGFITLNAAEVEVATVVGTWREKVARQHGFRDSAHNSRAKSLEQNIDAAGAELAASKATNCRWNMTAGEDLDEPDLWPHVEVRHTTRKNGGLIVRPKDPPGRLFVLVVGTLPRYRVVGWKRCEDARCAEYRWNDAWKVPQSGLTPL
jgi:hypothetical protein